MSERPASKGREHLFPWGTVGVVGRAPDVAVVHIVGRLDLRSAADVKQCLIDEVAAGNRRMVVDLGDTTFIDSSGLIALVSGHRATYLARGALRLARPNDQARLLLQFTTIDQSIQAFDSVEQALDGI
jgi:anti-sigma B factor antagonist